MTPRKYGRLGTRKLGDAQIKRSADINEKHILASCIHLLKIYKTMGILDFWRISSTGIPDGKGGMRPNVSMSGFSDLLILSKVPYAIFIEVKAPQGKQTEKQEQFEKRVSSQGHHYFVVRSAGELEKALANCGVGYHTHP